MVKKAIPSLLLFLLMTASSCMTTRLVANYDSDSIISHQETRVNFLWGLVQPKDIAAACESKSICKVATQTNLGFILVSAVTLGTVVPHKITWDCCPSVEKEEILR